MYRLRSTRAISLLTCIIVAVVLAGCGSGSSSSKKINIVSFTADTDAYQAFVSGHADAYTGDLPVVADYVKKNPSKYRMAGTAMSAGENYGIAVRKGDSAMQTALREALATLIKNGTYQSILSKWGVGDAGLKGADLSKAKSFAGPKIATSSLGLIAPNTLTVGSDTTYPPMESASTTNPGTFVGADVDLANALAKAMGLSGATIKNNSFDSIIPALQAKRFDIVMSSMNDTPDRAKQVDFVDYMTASEAILVKKSSKIHANNYVGMCGYTVSVEKGTTELDGLQAATKKC